MISILDLPPPEYVWEGDKYWGVLYYHYPDCLEAIQYCKDNQAKADWKLNDIGVLDKRRNMVIAANVAFEALEGEVVIMHVRAMNQEYDRERYDPFVEKVVDWKVTEWVIDGIENVKRASLNSPAG